MIQLVYMRYISIIYNLYNTMIYNLYNIRYVNSISRPQRTEKPKMTPTDSYATDMPCQMMFRASSEDFI